MWERPTSLILDQPAPTKSLCERRSIPTTGTMKNIINFVLSH
jgi:hypothetical protein